MITVQPQSNSMLHNLAKIATLDNFGTASSVLIKGGVLRVISGVVMYMICWTDHGVLIKGDNFRDIHIV